MRFLFPPSSLARSAVALCSAAFIALCPTHAARATDTASLDETVERYRLCIAMSLSPEMLKVKDAASATQVASQKCGGPRLELAGQFALDHPGTRQTQEYVDAVTTKLLADLSMWVENVQAGRESPNPAVRRVR